jgi:hypothetical protein
MAEYPGFVGETYPARSPAVSIDRAINWYPEIVESRKGKSIINYYPTPGLTLIADLSALGPGRAAFALDGRQWAVIGRYFIEFLTYGDYLKYPADGDLNPVYLAVDDNPATITANSKTPTQLFITSGGMGYIFDLAAPKLTEITGGVIDPDNTATPGEFFGATMGAFLDNYFVALTPNSRSFQISQPNDGTAWNPIDVQANLGSADNVKALITDHEYLYLAGSKRMAVYVNTGDADFPIKPVPGAFIEQGIRAPFSFQRIDNTLMWYGENEHGAGAVYRADGFIPKRVSTHAVEAVWCQYGKDADAIAFTQQRNGHTFYRLTFPAQDQTWVYDLTTDMWHERAAWDSAAGAYHAQTQRFHCYATGAFAGRYFVVGADGKIYREDDAVYTEDGRPIRRVRIAPVIARQNKMMFVSRLEIVIQPGIGLDGDPTAPGANPEMMLRYSPDSGATWSGVLTARAGRGGESGAQVVFDQLGSGKAWVPEISVTDPVNWVIVSAQIEATAGKW